MKQILFLAIVLTLFIVPVRAQKSVLSGIGKIAKQAAISEYEDFDFLTEEFSFLIQVFKMNHQFEVNNLNIKVRLRYESGINESKYPDFRAIAKDIEEFLNNYPNKTD
jgi:hypothetical protein